jgi:hypothetical protein
MDYEEDYREDNSFYETEAKDFMLDVWVPTALMNYKGIFAIECAICRDCGDFERYDPIDSVVLDNPINNYNFIFHILDRDEEKVHIRYKKMIGEIEIRYIQTYYRPATWNYPAESEVEVDEEREDHSIEDYTEVDGHEVYYELLDLNAYRKECEMNTLRVMRRMYKWYTKEDKKHERRYVIM